MDPARMVRVKMDLAKFHLKTTDLVTLEAAAMDPATL